MDMQHWPHKVSLRNPKSSFQPSDDFSMARFDSHVVPHQVKYECMVLQLKRRVHIWDSVIGLQLSPRYIAF